MLFYFPTVTPKGICGSLLFIDSFCSSCSLLFLQQVEYLSMKPPVGVPVDEYDAFENATFDAAVGRKVFLDQSAVHIPVEVYDQKPA